MSRYTAKQYARALYQAVLESKPSDQDKVLNNFVEILKQNQDLKAFDEIEKEFFSYERETQGIKIANVTTAKKLSEADEQQLIKDLNEYVGGQVEMKTKIDQGIVGGIVIRIGDEMVDGSVRTNLKVLKQLLIK